MELVLGTFCQSFSGLLEAGHLFQLPDTMSTFPYHAGSQTSPGAGTKAEKRKHPPFLLCLCC